MSQRNLDSMKSKFALYLEEMPDTLRQFVADCADAGFRLTYTTQNLTVLENYLTSLRRKQLNETLRNRAARYLGEVFRRDLGGKWELSCEDERDLYFGATCTSAFP
jgi:hypothetical protein